MSFHQKGLVSRNLRNALAVTIAPTQVKMHFGRSQTFSSSATGGTPPSTYQWCLNDTAVRGSTGSTWTFTPATVGTYIVHLRVTDSFAAVVQSNNATAGVETPMTATISPTHAAMYNGQFQTFSSSVSGGTPPYAYQWVPKRVQFLAP